MFVFGLVNKLISMNLLFGVREVVRSLLILLKMLLRVRMMGCLGRRSLVFILDFVRIVFVLRVRSLVLIGFGLGWLWMMRMGFMLWCLVSWMRN